MRKKLLVLSTIALMGLAACSSNSQPAATTAAETTTEAATEPETEATKKVAPMPCLLDIDNLEDGTYPAAFDVEKIEVSDDEEDPEIMITSEIFVQDLYDAVDITTLKEGDIVVVKGEEIEVKTTEDKNGFIYVNGDIEDGGVRFMANEGGTYVVSGMDDYSTYTSLGELEVFVDDETVLADYSDLEKPDGVKVEGKQEILEYFDESENKIFNQYNTSLSFEDGYLTEIKRVYIP